MENYNINSLNTSPKQLQYSQIYFNHNLFQHLDFFLVGFKTFKLYQDPKEHKSIHKYSNKNKGNIHLSLKTLLVQQFLKLLIGF